MTARPPQNYPKIFIDKISVIKPFVAKQHAASSFVDKPKPGWRKVIYDVYNDGLPSLFEYINSMPISENWDQYPVRFLKYIALLLMQIHAMFIYIYGFFYPYSLLPLDKVSDEFSRTLNWSESLIRAFSWHPVYHRCAVALCNDYIYVYEDANRIRALRHNQQRNILALTWHPENKDILIVATQKRILIWSIHDGPDLTNAMKDGLMFTTLKKPSAPGSIKFNVRERISGVNASLRNESMISTRSDTSTISTSGTKNVIILDGILPAPIVSMEFDKDSHKLYCCSPNSSNIAVLNIDDILGFGGIDKSKKTHIEYLRRFGQGITNLAWSPKFNRLATGTTLGSLTIYEPFRWSYKKWMTDGGIVQDMAWSKPFGRMLLIATKDKPFVYALPFLDDACGGDVGGNISLMKALDLTETKNEFGDTIGGRIQSLVWDKEGKRLAISFKDYPNTVLLYRTVEKPTVEFHQLGVLQGDDGAAAILLKFHDRYKNGALLTICWSDGHCQHTPLPYTPQELAKDNNLRINGSNYLNNSLSRSSTPMNNGIGTPSKGARSMTSFCHVSGNNSISSACSPLLMRQKCLARLQQNHLNDTKSINETYKDQ